MKIDSKLNGQPDPDKLAADLIEKINEGFIALDSQMNYLYINQRGGELLKRKPEDLIGKNHWEEYPQDKDTPLGRAYQQALETQATVYLEDYYAPGALWFESRIHPSGYGLSIFFDDITKRKQAEEALRESEEKFSAAFRASPIALVIATLDGKYIEMNQAFCDLLGYSREELLGKTAVDIGIVNAETRHEWAKAVERAGGVMTNIELNFRLRNGISRTTLFSVETIAFHGVPHRLTTILDITERKRSDQALRESEQRYHTLVDQIPAIVYIDDVSKNPGTTLFVNSYIKTALGFTAEEWLKGGYDLWREVIHPEDRAQVLSEYERIIQSGQPFEREYRVIARDGRIVWLHDRSTLLTDEEGRPLSMHGIAYDITERRQAEEQSRRHAARMEALAKISQALAEVGLDVRAVFETIVRYTAELIGDTSGIRLLSSDEQWLESVAFHNPNPEVKELMGLLHSITPTSANHSWLGPVLRTGQPLFIPVITQEQFRRNVQPEYLMFFEQVGLHSILIVPLRVKGRVIGTLGLSRDHPGHPYTPDDQVLLQDLADRASLTIQNAQLFEQIQGAHQRLQDLSNRLSETQESERRQLALELHDEFGQSLTALKMDLAWSYDHLPPRSKGLREKVDSALDLTNEAIQMTQRLASQLHPRMLDDLGLAAALEWHVNEWSKHTRIRTKVDLPEEDWDLNPSLNTALYRVCQEALTNVARHSGASKAEVSLVREGEKVVLTVHDNGRGIDDGKITSPESLGLLGMKERVEQIGGKLEVQSKIGKGTIVVARVPNSQPSSYPQSRAAPKEPGQAKKSLKAKGSRRKK